MNQQTTPNTDASRLQGVQHRIEVDGFAVIDDVLSPATCDTLIDALEQVDAAAGRRRGGLRDLFRLDAVRRLASHAALRSLVGAALSPDDSSLDAFAVRALLFDKTPDRNWLVSWHQDVTIAVKERHELPGFGPWSVKHGVPHVQPPSTVLETMLAARVHLDDCGAEDGALEVLPGSHRDGVASARPGNIEPLRVPVPRGGVMLMRPLLWHRSAKASTPDHRRVIHVEFASDPLPQPLRWHESIAMMGRVAPQV